MSVRGNLAPVPFNWASTHHYDWFPSEISKDHSEGAVVLVFGPQGDGYAPWEHAAFWAAAGSLLRLGRAVLFDADGLRTDSPGSFYAKVRRHLSDVIPQPHPDPCDPTLDLHTERAREYDKHHPW